MMPFVASLDDCVKQIEGSGLIDRCLQIAFTKGTRVGLAQKPRKRSEQIWWQISQALCGSTFVYEDKIIKLVVHQYPLGGEQVKLYANDPRRLVFEATEQTHSLAFAPVVDQMYKLNCYEPGTWQEHVERILQ